MMTYLIHPAKQATTKAAFYTVITAAFAAKCQSATRHTAFKAGGTIAGQVPVLTRGGKLRWVSERRRRSMQKVLTEQQAREFAERCPAPASFWEEHN